MGRFRNFQCIIILLFIWVEVPAQSLNFEDGFEDGDFSSTPAWIGDTTDYRIIQSDPNHLLQLHAESSGSRYLSTPSSEITGSWEFFIFFDGFEPSGSNKAEIFLMSDRADLNGPVNGYALRAGESGEDYFHIVRYENGVETTTILSDTTLIISEGGGYRIRVSRSSTGNWQLATGIGYDGKLYDSGSSALDNTFTASAYFGVRTTFTSTRTDKFYYDFKIDLPPFTISEAVATVGFIDLSFNRPYDINTVQPTDFELSHGIGSPASLAFPEPDKVRLFYAGELASNRYTLSVRDIQDELGNLIAADSEIGFIVYGSAEAGEVVLNEIMYDPPAGLPEYIELFNTTSKYLEGRNWMLGDQSRSIPLGDESAGLGPGGYLVISSDTVSLSRRFGHRNYVELGSLFPSLNNGGDAIWIRNTRQKLLDSLFYTSAWGGEEVALERRSPFAPSTAAANWGASPEGTGTPGAANMIEPDETPPKLLELTVIDASRLELYFSEELDQQSAELAANYALAPARASVQASSAGKLVTLSLQQEMTSGQSYELRVQNVEDIFGNRLIDTTQTFTYLSLGTPRPGDVVINEIHFLPTDSGLPEFIELFNTTDKNFDISSWLFGDAAASISINAGKVLPAHGYLVLTGNAGTTQIGPDILSLPGFPSLNDSGDALYLRNGEGMTMDSLYYRRDWDNNKDGHSLERKDPLAASNDASNWAASLEAAGHTAGLQNSVFQPDELAPDIIFAKFLPGPSVEMVFNEFIKITEDLRFELKGTPLQPINFDTANANRIELRVPPAIQPYRDQTIIVTRLSDLRGNTRNITEIPLASPLSPSDLVINEIMYQPLDDPNDHLPDQSEYIELYNTRPYAISLEGLYISGAPDENGNTAPLLPYTTRAKWIAPYGYALIYADPEPEFPDSRIARFFELDQSSHASSLLRLDRSTLSLGSENHALLVGDSSAIVIDSLVYDQGWHNPNLIDTRGIALERIRPYGPGNDPSNWSSNTTPRGGSPGFENSIYQAESTPPKLAGISFSTNPFSPDGDGYQDHLLINYRLGEPDYLLKVYIFDRYGRIVRKLADGIPSASVGSLLWDGRKDDGTSNRIGIYIIVFEAYNSASAKAKTFKKSVVLARRLN